MRNTNHPARGDITPLQCRLARTALGWNIEALSSDAKVSSQTVKRFERGEELRLATVDKIRVSLERAGIEFIPENGGGEGVRFKYPKHG
ncbi:helix-turn-helix transcriptional regulator [Rhizobium sp. NFR07]|uniref:helix-turn-helix domain-containing protein n=1 Tax=Rhizobium sp. NFR07 TaxID=1566262 RepID=UPI0015A69127|nr:helix-turn-helix transcriptional regulator [Rhizobium sp. NFR07]